MKVHSNNPHTLNEKHISEAIRSINELKLLSNIIFKRYGVHLTAEGKHFEYLL
jgi:hypothetical protein